MADIPDIVNQYPLAAVMALFPSADTVPAVCPVSDKHGYASALLMVMHLNDDHGWTRTQIADWLDSLGPIPLEGTAADAEEASKVAAEMAVYSEWMLEYYADAFNSAVFDGDWMVDFYYGF